MIVCLKIYYTYLTLRAYGFSFYPYIRQYILATSEEVVPLPESIDSSQDVACPHSKQSLRSFLGLFNFYKTYVPNAATVRHLVLRHLYTISTRTFKGKCHIYLD